MSPRIDNGGAELAALDDLIEQRLFGGGVGAPAPRSEGVGRGSSVEGGGTGGTEASSSILDPLSSTLSSHASTLDPPRSILSPVPNRLVATDVLPLDLDAWNDPDDATLWQIFRRWARTALPLMASDAAALAACGGLAGWVTPVFVGGDGQLVSGGAAAMAALLPLIAAYWICGLYSEVWVHPALELRQLTRLNTLVLCAAAAAAFVAVGMGGMVVWCGLAWALLLPVVPLARIAVRAVASRYPWWGYPVLVVGSGDGAAQVVHALLRSPAAGLRPSLVTDVGGGRRSSLVPVVNDPAILESIVRARAIRHAVVYLPSLSASQVSDVIDRYSAIVPHLLVLGECPTLPALWGAPRNSGTLSGLEVRNALMLVSLRVMKRVIDVTVAVTALLVTLPLCALVALLIKRGSPGPVFFCHKRIGQHGRMFAAFKFRTMYVEGDAILRACLERDPARRAEWERDQKLRDDPRVTSLGRLLRRTSIDELPQLWNVLRGDMSLVGPRPIIAGEVAKYGDVFKLYSVVKPGITGLWQVSGRTDIGYDERVRLDQYYIRHWSLWLDIYVMASTVAALVRRKGAY